MVSTTSVISNAFGKICSTLRHHQMPVNSWGQMTRGIHLGLVFITIVVNSQVIVLRLPKPGEEGSLTS